MDEAVGAEGVGVWPCGTKRGTAFTGIPMRRPRARLPTLTHPAGGLARDRGVASPGMSLVAPGIHPQPAWKAVPSGRGDLSR